MKLFLNLAGSILSGRFDTAGLLGKLRLLAVCGCLSILFNSPATLSRPLNALIPRTTPHTPQWSHFLQQKIDRPFSPLDTAGDPTSHFDKLAFRFVPFAIANVLQLNVKQLYLLQVGLGIVFPLLVWHVLFGATQSMPWATVGAVLLSVLYCGFSFFNDDVFFDAFAYFFLATAMWVRDWRVILTASLCAAFTDERAVAAAGFVYLWHASRSGEWSVDALWLWALRGAGFLMAYGVIRTGVGLMTGLTTASTLVGWNILVLNLRNIVLLIWSVFEGGWILVIAAAFALFGVGTVAARLLFVGCTFVFFATFLAGLLVGDCIRSHQYAFPLLLLAISVLARTEYSLPPKCVKLATALTLATPITLYLGMYECGSDYIFRVYPFQPGYISIIRRSAESGYRLTQERGDGRPTADPGGTESR